MNRGALAVVAVVALAAGAFWGVEWWRRPVLPSGVVASVDGQPLSEPELFRFLGSHRVFTSEDEVLAAISRFVDDVVLRREAERRGASGSPLAIDETRDQLTAEASSDAGVSDADVEAYYRENIDRYVVAASARIAYLWVPPSGDADADQRSIEAARIEAQLDRDPPAFFQLVAAKRENFRGGEIGPIPCDGTRIEGLPQELVTVGCGLRRWAISDAIETPQGLFVVRKTADVPARNRELARVAPSIRLTLENQARADALRAALNHLRDESEIVVSELAVERLVEGRAQADAIPRAPPRPPVPPGFGAGTP